MASRLELIALENFPLVEPGDELGRLIADSLQRNALQLQPGDVLVIAQKIVSKAEDRYVRLADVEPGPEAIALAQRADKDPRQVELILDESREVIRVRPGVIIVEHRLGYVHANAGIDKSNIANSPDDPRVLLLPLDPDASARALRAALADLTGVAPQIIINDSAGRAWRNGTVGIAIGTAGLDPVRDQIGERDLFDNVLQVTEPAVADELAAAASLLMGQSTQGLPVVLARGVGLFPSEQGSGRLIRDRAMDLFR
jgi:coenzyme F420-0:L-glutamate ligase/coenzyme F420-1:gamma-L-glutamate ligase